jgi:uncharacterized protein (DUF1501 family)
MTISASRRTFLRNAASLSFLGSAAPLAMQLAFSGAASAQTASAPYRALVCIFLFGGNDSHNTVLATDADSWGRYWSARNTGNDPIALMPVGTPVTPVGQVSPVTGRTSQRDTPEWWGGVAPIVPSSANPVPAGTSAAARTFALHPMLSPLVPLFNAGRLAVVANVGPLIVPTTKAQYQARSVRLPANLMSHNDQQSIWQSGAAEGARRGWGGLMADGLLNQNGLNSVFTAISSAGNAVLLAGETAVQYQISTNAQPAIRITPATSATLNGSAQAAQIMRDVIRDGGTQTYFAQDVAAKVRRSMDAADILNAATASPAATAVPAPPAFTNPITGNTESNTLAQQLQAVARMIAVNGQLGLRRQVFFVSLGGWDNHDFQNNAQPNLLAKVAQAMTYFDGVLASLGGQDMRPAVTTFTASDFSRTFTTNGDGTDHAWGGHYFVMGGAVRGRNMYGQYPTLGVDQGAFRNPDMAGNIQIPTTAVDQYAATMGRWLGVGDAELDRIFPNLDNFATRNLGFMG